MHRLFLGRRLSIRAVVGLGLALIMVATATLVYQTLLAVERSHSTQEELVLSANQSVFLEDVRAEYLSAWLLLVSSDGTFDERFLQRFEQSRDRIDWAFAVLRENARLLGPEEEARIDELSRQHQELRRDWTPIFTMFLEGKASEAKDRIAAEMVSRSDDFVDALATEVMRHRLAFNLAIGDYRDSRDIWQASALTVGGLWMVLLLSTAYLSHRWILRPLGDVARSARLIAAGELHSVAPVGGPAEIAGLAGDVNLMASSLINRSRELNEYLAQGLEARTRELEATNAALKTSEARLNAVVENAPVILFALDKDGVVTFAAGAGLALTGLAPDRAIGLSVQRLYAHDPAALDAFRRAFAGETVRVDIRYSSFCFETHLAPLKDGEGDVAGVIGVALDVTARIAMEEALRRSEERYRELFENANDLVFTHAVDGGFTSANRAALDLFGYSEEEILNMRMEDLLSPDMLERAQANLALKLEGAEDRTTYEIEVRTKKGDVIPLEVSSRLVFEDGKPVAIQGIARDVRERRRVEDALRRHALDLEALNQQLAAAHADLAASKRQIEEKSRQLEQALTLARAQARIDGLTGALNHGAIVEELRGLVERAESRAAVVMLDIDGMKAANDLYGHPFGDEMLRAVKAALDRDGAIVGRYGGDEFVAILEGAGAGEADAYRTGVLRAIQRAGLRDPHSGAEVPVVVSVGFCLYPDEAQRIEDLIALADTAMYAHKRERPVHAVNAGARRLGGEPATRVLGEIVPVLTAGGDLSMRLALVAEKLATEFSWTAVEVLLNPSRRRGAEVFATYPRIQDETLARGFIARRLAGDKMRRMLASTRRVLIIDDPESDERLTQDQRDVSRFLGIRSAVVAPLFWEGHLVGSLTAGSERPHAFGPPDAQLLMGIAGQVAYLAILPDRFDDLKRRVGALQAGRREGARLMAVIADAHGGFPSHDFARLRDVAEKLALKLGLPPEQADEIGLAAMLHDVGKYLVPSRILANPLELSDSEWEIMRRHTLWGYELLNAHAGFALQAQAARWHHERWDGLGYPDGLVADEIPLPAAIAAVADAMDAMVYDRVYRDGMPAEAALAQVVAGAGRQFSPRVVEALVALHREGRISFSVPAREESRRAA